MRIKAINRSEEECTRERSQDLQKVHKNLDPSLHPLEKATEYTRALNAAKLERIFAKPFVAAFAHDDGITCLAKNPQRLNSLIAGSADGDIRLWDIPSRRCLRRLVGHTAGVKGVAATPSGDACVSCSTDCTVRLWRIPAAGMQPAAEPQEAQAALEFHGANGFRAIDHHWQGDRFATAGAQVDVWDHARSEPMSTFRWGAESALSVRFNPVEPEIFTSTGSDRSIALYDLRSSTPIRKLIMQTRSNAIAWNPLEAFNFTVASEDCNLYTYDMRKLDMAACLHQDFVSAVMDLDYSPTGREFVAGSYDRSVRMFSYNGGHSKEVFHTKRMQRVFSVRFSADGSYVFSGSDDMNVRIWKADASAPLGKLLPRQKQTQAYNQALIRRFKHLPEINRIVRHRHVPKPIYKAGKLRRTIVDADARKLQNVMKHSKPGSVKVKPARQKKIVGQEE
ncbi:hypothetical protein WJX74_002087 [Apatococcus lobatus]|uniref:DDB1- and CUL4-associated factor 13 n=2 Tax=Apatococcus TaxID=904362 RepID=A0AAW1SPZ3_9CHLO